KGPRLGSVARSPEHIVGMVNQRSLLIAWDAAHLAPTTHQAVMHAAFAMRYDVDIHCNGDRRAALVFESVGEFRHLVLVAELGCGRVLPPDLGPFARSEYIADSPVGDHHRIGSPGSHRRLLLSIRDKAVLAAG